MVYERFVFWFWESPTTGWHACKVKKHFLIICIYFYLIRSTTPKRFDQRFIFPNNSFVYANLRWLYDWSISFKAECSAAMCTAVTGETAIFNAPKAASSGNKWAGNMLICHFGINMKRLKIRFKNDSFQWFRVDSFFWETITLNTVHFQISNFAGFFIHLEPCYTLHERSFSKIHNRGTLRSFWLNLRALWPSIDSNTTEMFPDPET